MAIAKTMLTMGGGIYRMDSIEHEGVRWLVPNWILSQDGRHMRPIRIIRPLSQPFEPFGKEFLLSFPIPKSVSNGVVPQGQEALFEVVENPAIILPNPDVLN